MADYLTNDTELTSIANAIRTKGGTSASLTFPSGFVDAIEAISGGSTGKEFVSGSFTCPDSNTTQVISFGKTFNKYLFLIEMTESSKTALINSGVAYDKSYAFFGLYPITSINNHDASVNAASLRYKPSADSLSSGTTGSALTCTDTSITGIVRPVDHSSSAQHLLIRGYTYNYIVISLD